MPATSQQNARAPVGRTAPDGDTRGAERGGLTKRGDTLLWARHGDMPRWLLALVTRAFVPSGGTGQEFESASDYGARALLPACRRQAADDGADVPSGDPVPHRGTLRGSGRAR